MGTQVTLERLSLSDYEAVLQEEEPEEGSAECDVGKMWHALQFLLTGSAWEGPAPLDFLVNGGHDLAEPDGDSFSIRAFSPAQVKEIAEALAAISPESLQRRFDPAAMRANDIYPDVWTREDEIDQLRDELTRSYRKMQQFIAETAREGSALLLTSL
jgi:hypothetical protein